MPRKLSLPARFPEAAFIIKAKIWTPQRSTIEIEGHYEHDQGFLALLLLSSVKGLNPHEASLAKELLELLTPSAKDHDEEPLHAE